MSIRVAKVPGSKWNLASWIVGSMPQRPIYLEPYFGSGAILYAKPRVLTEIVNDRDDRVVALFRCVRDRPESLARAIRLTPYARSEWQECRRPDLGLDDELEKARRFLVAGWQSHGGRTGSRSGPALDLLRAFRGRRVLVYLDPPYPAETEEGIRDVLYEHEMLDEESHVELLSEALMHPGPLLASSYRNDIYDRVLLGAGWSVAEQPARGEHSVERVEALYLNPIVVAEMKRVRQLDLLGVEIAHG